MEEKEFRLKAVEIASRMLGDLSYVSDIPKNVFKLSDEIIGYVKKTDKKDE